MTQPRRCSPSRLFVLTALLCGMAAVICMALLILADYKTTVRETELRNTVLAQLLEEHARRAFDTSRIALTELAATIPKADRPVASAEIKARMRRIIADVPIISSFWLMDSQGKVVFTTLDEATDGVDFSDRPYFRIPAAGQDLYVGGLMLGRVSHKWFFSLSTRLTDSTGHFVGVLQASMRIGYFADLYTHLGLDPQDNIGIYKLDGTIVARSTIPWLDDHIPTIATHPLITTHIHKAPAGAFEVTSPIDGVTRIAAYRVMPGWPLVVTAAVAKRPVLASWLRRSFRSAIYGAAALLCLALLASWGFRRIKAEEALQARNAMLLNEVHHRVKNNLAIIQSLLMLEANRAPPEARAGYDDSIARVEAMGLVHHLLYQSQSFEGINLATYLPRLCQGLQASAGPITLRTEIQAVSINLDSAIPVALIVNEIITNALKHAFSAGEAGDVTVTLGQDGCGGLTLTIADTGHGFAPGRGLEGGNTLGLRLVKQLVRQLDGTISLESDTTGSRFTIAFPWKTSGPSTAFRGSAHST